MVLDLKNVTKTVVTKNKLHLAMVAGVVIILILSGLIGVVFYQNKLNQELGAKREQAAYLDKITIGMIGANQGFYPDMPADSFTQNFQMYFYEGLTSFDKNMRIEPKLAESWENPNDTTWRFRLKKGIKFSNGKEMTADDVAQSINLAIANENMSPIIPNLDKAVVVDKYTVDVTTKAPDPVTINLLPYVFVMPTELVASKDFTHPIGTGPYKYVGSDETTMTFVRNDSYWGTKPKIKNVVVRAIGDNQEKFEALKSGEIDFMDMAEDIPDNPVTNKGAVIVKKSMAPIDASYIGINAVSDHPNDISVPGNPFKDIRVRQAFQLALDIPAAITESDTMNGAPSSQLVTPIIFGYNSQVKANKYNLAKAKELMKEAGYENGFSFSLTIAKVREKFANAIKKQLAQAGFNVNIDLINSDQAGYEKMFSGVNSTFYIGWACATGDGLEAYENLVGKDGSGNIYGYTNPKIDELIKKTKSTFKQNERKEYMNDLAVEVNKDKYLLPMLMVNIGYAYPDNFDFTPRADEMIFANEITVKPPKELQKDYTYFGALKHLLHLG